MYVDECGLDEKIQRDYGRSQKGTRLMSNVLGKRSLRTSIIAGLCNGKPLAPFHFQGYCNTEVILTWVEKILLPELKPGMTVIWDNASFHQSAQFKALIESAGCQLLFLPTYSPDLNPIERFWARLKALIRRIRQTGMTLKQCLSQLFKSSLYF